MEEKEQRKYELWGLTPRDIQVIFALWSVNFVRPWLFKWHLFTYNLNLQRVASFQMIVFIVECFMCVSLSLICDVRHQKYKVYMYFLFLYGIFPLYGLVENILPSFTLRYLMDWIHSTGAIISPIQYCAVFVRKPNISRMNSYVWLTIFRLLEALNKFLIPFILPIKCPLSHATIFPIWLIMLQIYWQILFLVCFTYKHAGEETFPEKHLKTAIQGVSQSLQEDKNVVCWKLGSKTVRFLIFVVLLLPAIYSTLLEESLELLELRKDLNQKSLLSTTHMTPLGGFLGTAVIASIVIIVRWKWSRFANLLTLGVPYLFNLLALATILWRISGDQTGQVLDGRVPDNSSMVVLFINTDYNNRSACINSDYFDPLRIRASEHIYRVVRTNKEEIDFMVVLDPIYDTFIPVRHVMKVELNSFVIFQIQLGNVPLNRDFIVNAVQIVHVRGTEKVRPTETPQYAWMTSVSEFVNKTVLRVTSENGTVFHELPALDQAIVETVPYTFTNISLVWMSPVKETNLVELRHIVHTPLPNTVYSVMIHEHNRLASLAVPRQRIRPSARNMWASRTTLYPITLMQVRTPSHPSVPIPWILRRDLVMAVGYFIHGAAQHSISTGFLHLFWMDAPLRLRTTLMALSMTAMWLLEMLPGLKKIDEYSGQGSLVFSYSTVLILLVFQCAFTIVHFVFAPLFYYTYHRPILPPAPSVTSSNDYGSTPSFEPINKRT